jgi:hypothetical protein
MGWRGEERAEKSQSMGFVNFVKLGKLGLSLPSSPILTDFNRVWQSLLVFEFSTRFHTVYLYWLVKSYDFTSQLASLTTMIYCTCNHCLCVRVGIIDPTMLVKEINFPTNGKYSIYWTLSCYVIGVNELTNKVM